MVERSLTVSSQLVALKENAKLNLWYDDIKSQKQSGLTVDEWCEQRGLNRHTYYYRYKVVMRALEERLSQSQPDPIHFAALPPPSLEQRTDSAAIRLRLGDLEVEIPAGADPSCIRNVIEALKC